MGSMPPRSGQQPAGRSRLTSIVAGSEAGGSGGDAAGWALLPARDQEAGNPCLGIAIGCVLSLPIWLGLTIVSLLLR